MCLGELTSRWEVCHVGGRTPQVEVGEPATYLAPEMGVRFLGGIKTYLSVVDGEHVDGALLKEQVQRVVHRGLGERGQLGTQGGIYLIGCRMGVMLLQIAHDGYTLGRGLDAVGLQEICDVPCFHLRVTSL